MSRAGLEPATPCLKVQTESKPVNDFSRLPWPNPAKPDQKAATVATSGNHSYT